VKRFAFIIMLLLPVAVFGLDYTYTFDFEATDGGFVPSTFQSGCVAAPFGWGTWTQDCAPSGGKVWGACLTVPYQNSAAEILVMPALVNLMDAGLSYVELDFDHGGKVYTYWDGVSVMYSYTGNIDATLSEWQTVPGALFIEGGYNANCTSGACSNILSGSTEDNIFGEGDDCIGTSNPSHMKIDLTSLAVDSGHATMYIGWLIDTSSVVEKEGYWLDNVVVTADAEIMASIPNAHITSDDIFVQGDLQPDELLTVQAIIHNTGTEDITSLTASFYVDDEATPFATVNISESIAPGMTHVCEVDWDTTGYEERNYLLTVELTNILPDDMDSTDNEASKDVPLPAELAYFQAQGFANQVRLEWKTLSEVDNLGWNIYRKINTGPVSRPMSQPPVKLNDSLIPGHGTSNEPHTYLFTDTVRVGSPRPDFIYILESVSTTGETERFTTHVDWLFE